MASGESRRPHSSAAARYQLGAALVQEQTQSVYVLTSPPSGTTCIHPYVAAADLDRRP